MSSEHDVLMRRHTMIKNHIDLNFVSGKNKFTDFSGHSCDRLVTCPGVPHLSPASAGISSSPEAGKQRDGWTAPTPSARISCRNFRSDELEPELRSTCTLVPSHRSIHVSRASFCSATSVCKRVKNRHHDTKRSLQMREKNGICYSQQRFLWAQVISCPGAHGPIKVMMVSLFSQSYNQHLVDDKWQQNAGLWTI